MKHIEKALQKEGFHVLQEKEDLIYFDKTWDTNDKMVQQISLVYDKMNKKIQSIDMFVLGDNEMSMVHDRSLHKHYTELLSS